MANAAFTAVSGRQYPMFAVATIAFNQMSTTATPVTIIKLPPGAIVVGGYAVVDTASDIGTSGALAIGDSGSANRYGSVADIKAAGKTALTLTGYANAGGLDIAVTPTLVGTAATAGSIRVLVEYIIDGRAHENQPN